jgi:hypothetical protein
MADHTPGPWVVIDGNVYQEAKGQTFHEFVDEEGNDRSVRNGLIALVYGDHNNEDRHYTRDANTRLIAAAPELLDACLLWQRHAQGTVNDASHWCGECAAAHRAAIAKALGQEATHAP